MGVHPSASHDQVRQAYRDLARRLHPDRQAGASPAESALAERRMREINQAWEVLGDRAARRRYDEALDRGARVGPARTAGGSGTSPPRRTAPKPPVVADEADDDDLVDAAPHLGTGGTMLMRGLPWIVIVGVLVAIFLISAVAKGGNDPKPVASLSPGECFVSQGGVPVREPCSTPRAARLEAVVARTADCPEGLEPRLYGAQTVKYCVDPTP